MADFITSDRSLKEGDLVFSEYHKGQLLFKITKIERRYLTQQDIKHSVYSCGQVGDEYNPYVTIESVADLGVPRNPKKKFRKTVKTLDAAWLKRAEPEHIQAHIKMLYEILSTHWP